MRTSGIRISAFSPYGWLRRELRGPQAQALDAARRLLRPLANFGALRLVGWEMGVSPQAPAPAAAQFLVREMAPSELATVSKAFDRPLGELHRRSRLGDRCFCAFAGAVPVHMRWFSRRPTELPEPNLFACPASDEIFAYDLATAGPWRGKHAGWATRRQMDLILSAEGLRRGFLCHTGSLPLPPIPEGPLQKVLLDCWFVRSRGGRPFHSRKLVHPLYEISAIPAPEPARQPPQRKRAPRNFAERRPLT